MKATLINLTLINFIKILYEVKNEVILMDVENKNTIFLIIR